MKEDYLRVSSSGASELSLALFCSQNHNTLENRMLMLDGMPAVRVKTELLESEQGVSRALHRCPLLLMSGLFTSRAALSLLSHAYEIT